MFEDTPLHLFILGFTFIFLAIIFDGLLTWTGYDKNCPQRDFGNTLVQTLLLCRFVARLLAGVMLALFVITFVLIACASAMST